MTKEYIRTTHNFNNETREWIFRGDRGQDKYGAWDYERLRILGPIWSFGVHALKRDGWRRMDWIVEETIKMYLGGAACPSIEKKFKEFINSTPDYKAIIEQHILKEFEILIKEDQVRVREKL